MPEQTIIGNVTAQLNLRLKQAIAIRHAVESALPSEEVRCGVGRVAQDALESCEAWVIADSAVKNVLVEIASVFSRAQAVAEPECWAESKFGRVVGRLEYNDETKALVDNLIADINDGLLDIERENQARGALRAVAVG